jgi:mono/diheme cytochrome c family protein
MKLVSRFLSAIAIVAVIASCKTVQTTDEVQVTYSSDVRPIIDASCGTKCHSAEKHAGGIDLSSYAGVSKEAVGGKLLAAIRHEDGVEPMPRNAEKLDGHAIAIIAQWIEGGMPE